MKEVIANEFVLRKLCVYVIPSGKKTTTAIAIGAAAGAAILFAGPAIAVAWWLRSKAQDRFVDVPGLSTIFISFISFPVEASFG